MALRKTTVREIPKDAVRLTEEEAVHYQLEAARNWKPQSEMWPLLYGSLGVGALTSFSGAIINDHFRRAFFLPKSTLLFIGLPLLSVSAITSTLIHYQFITRDILLMKTPCSACMQSRTALLMGFFGTVYPIFICSIGNMLQSQVSKTIYLPSIFKEPRQIFQTWQKMFQMKSNLFTGLFVMNILVAVTAAHLQQKAFYRLNQAQ